MTLSFEKGGDMIYMSVCLSICLSVRRELIMIEVHTDRDFETFEPVSQSVSQLVS